MPRFDRTGPSGYGPLTGRGLGPCGRGFNRMGYGMGRGYRNFYQPSITQKEEEEIMEGEVELLEDELKAVKERLKDLKGKK